MGENTSISWCDHTWSPWYGCTQVSLGPKGACEACYARQLSETRFGRVVFGGPGRGIGTRDVRADSAWKTPLQWNRKTPGAFVFPSMCDPFDNHPDLAAPRRRFFDLIRATPALRWILLTKRPGNIIKLFADTLPPTSDKRDAALAEAWPRNVVLGTTAVTQAEADAEVPKLLDAKRRLGASAAMLSLEPLQEGIVLQDDWLEEIDLVVVGGESAQGSHIPRPMHPLWAWEIATACQEAGVPFDFKQWGDWKPLEANDGDWPVDMPGHIRLTSSGDRTAQGWPFQRVGTKFAGRLLGGMEHNGRISEECFR